jgi:hypothetical protein
MCCSVTYAIMEPRLSYMFSMDLLLLLISFKCCPHQLSNGSRATSCKWCVLHPCLWRVARVHAFCVAARRVAGLMKWRFVHSVCVCVFFFFKRNIFSVDHLILPLSHARQQRGHEAALTSVKIAAAAARPRARAHSRSLAHTRAHNLLQDTTATLAAPRRAPPQLARGSLTPPPGGSRPGAGASRPP